MDRPKIATVLDGGLHDGRPFFVLELVKCRPIGEQLVIFLPAFGRLVLAEVVIFAVEPDNAQILRAIVTVPSPHFSPPL